MVGVCDIHRHHGFSDAPDVVGVHHLDANGRVRRSVGIKHRLIRQIGDVGCGHNIATRNGSAAQPQSALQRQRSDLHGGERQGIRIRVAEIGGRQRRCHVLRRRQRGAA